MESTSTRLLAEPTQLHIAPTAQPRNCAHAGVFASAVLRLCLRRVHGKLVEAQPMAVPPEGVVIGGEGEPVGVEASLHIGPRHAMVRSVRLEEAPETSGGKADEWRIEPANQALVLAVNDRRVPWGESVPLHHGDRVEVGFALLVVEMAGNIAGGEPQERLETAHGVPLLSTAGLAVPRAPVPSRKLEHLDLSAKPEPFAVPKDSPRFGSAEWPVPADWRTGTFEIASDPAPESFASPEPPESDGSPEQPGSAEGPAGPSEAELLAAMLAAPGRESTVCCESGGLPAPQGEDVLASILREAEPPQPAPAPDDILAVLALESERAVACGGRLPASAQRADPCVCPPVGATPSGERFTDALADLLGEGAGSASRAGSMEEILEGPLSIDDVLERLRQRAAADPGHSPFSERHSDPAVPDLLDAVARVPDPLLLLAGLEAPPVREPELAPVLHREHRTTGIRTPYRYGSATIEIGEYATDAPQTGAPQEEPWPPKPR